MSDHRLVLFSQELDTKPTEEETIQQYLNEGKTVSTSKSKQKLDIFKVLRAVDNKDREFYDNLTDEEKKGFAPFVMVRWLASVQHSNKDMQEWWIQATNLGFNYNLLNLNSSTTKHPKLQWLMATTTSPGMGVMRHEWIGYKKKTKTTYAALRKLLQELYPSLKDSEIDYIVDNANKNEMKEFLRSMGYSDNDIKKITKK